MVRTTETTRDPTQPSRLEKKTNTASGLVRLLTNWVRPASGRGTTVEDGVTTGADETRGHDEDDAQEHLPLEELDDPDDDEDYGSEPQQ
jgi:hypothetical protein